MRRDRESRISERWFRVLLWFYPPDFRDDLEEAIAGAYLRRARDASSRGALAIAWVWIVALVDAGRTRKL